MTRPKPILLLDVDGVLNPYDQLTKKGFTPPKARGAAYEWHLSLTYPTGWESKGLKVITTPDHGVELTSLASLFNLFWCTTWNNDANGWISPLVGLPHLPVLELPDGEFKHEWKRTANHRGSWKTRWIAKWLDEYGWYRNGEGEPTRLPWAFVDDEVNRFDNQYLAAYWGETGKQDRVAARLLLHTPPTLGLTAENFKTLRKWGEENQV